MATPLPLAQLRAATKAAVNAPGNAGRLSAYLSEVANAARVGSITVQGIPIILSDQAIGDLIGANLAAQQDATFAVSFNAGPGQSFTLNAAMIAALVAAATYYRVACRNVETQCDAAIHAIPPTMTTVLQIDAAFAAVHTTY